MWMGADKMTHRTSHVLLAAVTKHFEQKTEKGKDLFHPVLQVTVYHWGNRGKNWTEQEAGTMEDQCCWLSLWLAHRLKHSLVLIQPRTNGLGMVPPRIGCYSSTWVSLQYPAVTPVPGCHSSTWVLHQHPGVTPVLRCHSRDEVRPLGSLLGHPINKLGICVENVFGAFPIPRGSSSCHLGMYHFV